MNDWEDGLIQDFQAWLNPEGTRVQPMLPSDPRPRTTMHELQDALRLFYELRAARAVYTQGGRSPEDLAASRVD